MISARKTEERNGLFFLSPRQRKHPLFAAGVSLLVFLFFFLLCRSAFETNDDITFAMAVNRGSGTQDPFMLLGNYVLGSLLSFLYRATNMLPWYGLTQIFGIWCALTAVTYVLMNVFEGWMGLLLSLLILNLFGADACLSLQFTKTAGIAAAGGIFLMLYGISRERTEKLSVFLGLLIALYGDLLRSREFEVVLLVMLLGGVYLLLSLGEAKGKAAPFRAEMSGNVAFAKGRETEEKREIAESAGKTEKAERAIKRKRFFARVERKGPFRYFSCLLLLLFSVLVFSLVQRLAYARHPEAEQYRAYHLKRSALFDYGFPSFDQNRELFDSLGITETAWQLYTDYNYYDPDILTEEKLDALAPFVKNKRDMSLRRLSEYFRVYPVRFFENRVFYGLLAVFCLYLVYGRRTRSSFLTAALALLFLIGISFYLYCNGRYNISRVDGPIFLAFTLLFCMLIDPASFRMDRKSATAFFLVLLALNQRYWKNYYRQNTLTEMEQARVKANLLAQVSHDAEHLYLTKRNTYSVNSAYGPLSLVPIDVAANLASLGGWETGSPVYTATLKRYGVRNPYRDLIDNEQVYLVDNQISLTMDYICEYYDEGAWAEEVESILDDPVYRIRSGEAYRRILPLHEEEGGN